MARENDAARVAAIFGDVVADPGDGGGAVIEEVREADFRVDPVIGDDGDEALGRQGLADELVIVLRTGFPRAAIEEDQDGRIRRSAGGREDIEALPRMGAEGGALLGQPSALVTRADGIEEGEGRTGRDPEGGQCQAGESGEGGECAGHASLKRGNEDPNDTHRTADS